MRERVWRCDWIGRLVWGEKGGVTREGVCVRVWRCDWIGRLVGRRKEE